MARSNLTTSASNPSMLSPAALRESIQAARSTDELAAASANVRHLARDALAAGRSASATTRLISEFNDLVTEQLVQRTATELGLDLDRACWLVFGSQGRSEQTLATDQDNGLVFESHAQADRARWLELGEQVNLALDACGYPLCRGGVMAGQRPCCLTAAEWCERFDHWMEHGAPDDLLNASIYFDMRALVGRRDLMTVMRGRISSRAAALPRFLKQMADNALRNPVALTWLGVVRGKRRDGHLSFDLKMQGTALYVEAARLYALAHGITATGTLERLDAVAAPLRVPALESEAWRQGFESLQRLRLEVQARTAAPQEHPNRIELDTLSQADLAALTQALRAARLLQQRMKLDYQR